MNLAVIEIESKFRKIMMMKYFKVGERCCIFSEKLSGSGEAVDNPFSPPLYFDIQKECISKSLITKNLYNYGKV
jgi:hypothetical protein